MTTQDIGYMQVQIRLYHNGELYDTFALNAYDEPYLVTTKLVSCEHQATADPTDESKNVVQIIIKIFETNYTISLLIPVHQSERWEVVNPSKEYSVGFYCIQGSYGE